MDTKSIQLNPERRAELAEFAKRHDQDEATALDTILAEVFAWEKQYQDETVAAVLEGNADLEAGRTKPAEEVYRTMRLKHGL